jgi:hypothetical protein
VGRLAGVSPATIRAVAASFRRGILGKRAARDMCFAVCAPLQSYLSLCGVETRLVEGNFGTTNHFWLELLDGTIIDPTADQFPELNLPAIYIGPRPAAHEAAVNRRTPAPPPRPPAPRPRPE